MVLLTIREFNQQQWVWDDLNNGEDQTVLHLVVGVIV